MSTNGWSDMAIWLELAVRAVGPLHGREYAEWLAEVDRVALDLRVKAAAGKAFAGHAADLADCLPVEGVLLHAGVDGEHGRLVVRVPDPSTGASDERTLYTEPLTLRRGQETLRAARSGVGRWTRLLVEDAPEDEARVLYVTGDGPDEVPDDGPDEVPVGAAPQAREPEPEESAQAPEPVRAAREQEASAPVGTRRAAGYETAATPAPLGVSPAAEAPRHTAEPIAEPAPAPVDEPAGEPAGSPTVEPSTMILPAAALRERARAARAAAAAPAAAPAERRLPEPAREPVPEPVRPLAPPPRPAPLPAEGERASVPEEQPEAAAPSVPAPPPATAAPLWEDGSVVVWRNIDRAWSRAYRTSCLLALRDRAIVDGAGRVLNLDELVDLARQSPEPDTPRGRDLVARYPA